MWQKSLSLYWEKGLFLLCGLKDEVGMTAQICTRTWNVTTKYNLVKLTGPEKYHKNLPSRQINTNRCNPSTLHQHTWRALIYHLNFSQESFIESNLFFFTNLLLTFNLTHIHAWKLPSRTRVWSFGQRAASLKQLGVKGLAQGVEPTVALREGASFALLLPPLGFILPIQQRACFTNFQYKDEIICQFFEIKMTLIQTSVLDDCAKPWNLSSDEICLHPAPTIKISHSWQHLCMATKVYPSYVRKILVIENGILFRYCWTAETLGQGHV